MSTEREVETNFDPFEETPPQTDENDAPAETQEEDEVSDKEEGEEESTDEAETEDEPAGETEDKTNSKEKMIPESRFKAALKDVQEKMESVLQENAKLKATPAPDRENDPEGYEKHLRLEMSKALMREFKPDYVEVITHYQEMAKLNPSLNQMVADHELPAKFAYDLAKRDLEIRELTEARNSDEWKEFQEFKKNKGKATIADDLVSQNPALKLPKNLNRATASKKLGNRVHSDDEDYLFGDRKI